MRASHVAIRALSDISSGGRSSITILRDIGTFLVILIDGNVIQKRAIHPARLRGDRILVHKRYKAKRAPRALMEFLETRVLMTATFDVSGVQNAALDQPRVYALLRSSPDGAALQDGFFTPFLDTGTSGILLSQETTAGFGVNNLDYQGQPISFFDVGVAGQTQDNVSEPLYTAVSAFSPANDGSDESTYIPTGGPFNLELNPVAVSDPSAAPIDIFGMAAMQGKVMVMDPKPVDGLNLMNTYLYAPGTPFNSSTADTDPGIPQTQFHVQLNYADFSRFTSTDPQGAPGPTLFPNPMFGPNPISQIDSSVPPGNSPPISLAETIDGGSYKTQGSFLFDTGAASSFISQDMAAQLHVHYSTDANGNSTYLGDSPQLVDDSGHLVANQFTLPLGGADGSIVTVAGFYLDSLTLQTTEGAPIRFLNEPVLVLDVPLQDSTTGDTIILDGDFGMNNLVTSIDASNGGLGNARGTPWDWETFDQPNAVLGLTPSTGSISAIGIADAHLFYNNSYFDNYTPGFSPADANAIATDKTPLLPGDTAAFDNYSSYDKGINGLMIDVVNIPGPINATDFTFAVGNSSDPSKWTAAPTPTLTYLPGQGDNGADRYEFIWPDGSIRGEWLQATLTVTLPDGSTAPDTIFFGNAPGESGNDPTNAFVDGSDFAYARDDPHNFLNPALITDRGDYNRDHFVDGTDLAIARDFNTNFLNALQLISPPANVSTTAVPAAPAAKAGVSSKRPLFLTQFGTLDGAAISIPTSAPVSQVTAVPAAPVGSGATTVAAAPALPADLPPPPADPATPVAATTPVAIVTGPLPSPTPKVKVKAHHKPPARHAHHHSVHAHVFSTKRIGKAELESELHSSITRN